MSGKIKFRQSICFKITILLSLMLIFTVEVIGAVFMRQLEYQEWGMFKQRIELPSHVYNSLTDQLEQTDTGAANHQIQTLLSQIDNVDLTKVLVVNAKEIIRGTSESNNQTIVGRRINDVAVRKALTDRHAHSEIISNKTGRDRYYVNAVPLLNRSNRVIGVVYLRANLRSVDSAVNRIALTYVSVAVITIILGFGLAVIISREISRPIEEIWRQALRIAQGNFSERIKVRGNDELSRLEREINNLSIQFEESQESFDAERNRISSVLSHMSDGVLATDRLGNLTIVNNTALRFLSVEDEEMIIGKSILDVLKIRRQFTIRKLVDERLGEVFLDDFDDGQILSASFSPINWESGFISGIVCVLHDVTAQEKTERDRKEFVSNVSHELRTPLTSVKAYVETLKDGAIEDKELSLHFLEVVDSETDRMIRMVNDLLSLSRMDSGTIKLNLEYVNINELFNSILDRLDMILKQEDSGKYTIARHLTSKDLWVEIDPDKFTQVVDNIINNAIKYSPGGGEITARLIEAHNYLILSISDQGIGIPRKDLDHIFDRFFRVDRARSRKQGGVGLGLAISKEVINMLGGQIWVSSVEGKGTTFYISLPYMLHEKDEWDD